MGLRVAVEGVDIVHLVVERIIAGVGTQAVTEGIILVAGEVRIRVDIIEIAEQATDMGGIENKKMGLIAPFYNLTHVTTVSPELCCSSYLVASSLVILHLVSSL